MLTAVGPLELVSNLEKYMPLWDFFVISSLLLSCSSSSSCCSLLHCFSAQLVRYQTSHKTEVSTPLLAGSLHADLSLAGECGHFFPVASYHADNKKNSSVYALLDTWYLLASFKAFSFALCGPKRWVHVNILSVEHLSWLTHLLQLWSAIPPPLPSWCMKLLVSAS